VVMTVLLNEKCGSLPKVSDHIYVMGFLL
jgi:hypothetical protein